MITYIQILGILILIFKMKILLNKYIIDNIYIYNISFFISCYKSMINDGIKLYGIVYIPSIY